MYGASPICADGDALALQLLRDLLNSFCAISANSPLFDELPISANERVAGAGDHALLERVVDHDRLTAGQHGDAGRVDAELQVDVEAVLLVVAAVLARGTAARTRRSASGS